MKRQYRKQRGMVLVVAMIMLILMTLMALATFNLGRSSLDIIGNMQESQAVVNAANVALQEAISTRRLFQNPNAIFLNPCTTQNTRCVDVNGDGVNDIQVSLTPAPTCSAVTPVAPSIIWAALALNANDQNALPCLVSNEISSGIQGVGGGNSSLCADTMWELNAVSTDLVTNASVTVTEGVNVRVGVNSVASFCPPLPPAGGS